MKCLIVSKYGQIADKVKRILDWIYCYEENYYFRSTNAFDATSMIDGKDIIVIDYSLEGATNGLELLNELYRNAIYDVDDKEIVLVCMPEVHKNLEDNLDGGYNFKFKILDKTFSTNEFKEALMDDEED